MDRRVQARAELGALGGIDTVMGADQARTACLTLVERVSGYVVMRKLSARTKEQAAAALSQAIERLHAAKVKTITLDNGDRVP